MSLTSTAGRIASPKRAARHYTGPLERRAAKGNEIPALVWLWVAIVLLAQVRRGALSSGGFTPPSLPEVATYGIGAGAVVVVGSFAPRAVMLILAAVLLAGVLGYVGPVAGALSTVEGYIGGALGGGPGRASWSH